MSMEKVIAIATSDLGYTENPPYSNKTKFGSWYGLDGNPWCVMALVYWFHQAGEANAFCGGWKTASCGAMLSWFKSANQTVSKEKIRRGDIVILNFSGTKDTEHCGLVIGKLPNGLIETIEGNTAPGLEGSQDNGGSVARKYRNLNQVVGVCRPAYKVEIPKDALGHWAEDAIEFCMTKGYMRGYEDGSFRPDGVLTRGELAQVIYNIMEEL